MVGVKTVPLVDALEGATCILGSCASQSLLQYIVWCACRWNSSHHNEKLRVCEEVDFVRKEFSAMTTKQPCEFSVVAFYE